MALQKDIRWLLSQYQGPRKPKVYNKNAKKILKGAIYLYRYSNPKYKKVLEFYDARPMVILLNTDAKYLFGINIHFLPWTMRIQFCEIIIKKLKYKNRLKYSDIKKAADTVRMPHVFAYFALRKYIRSRIGSKLYQFSFDNWRSAVVNIPPNFKKEQDAYIMRDINRKVRELRASKKKKN